MGFPTILFWVMLIWGLYDGDVYPREGAIMAGVWVALLVLFILFNVNLMWFVVPTVILDIVLILKVFGGDVALR